MSSLITSAESQSLIKSNNPINGHHQVTHDFHCHQPSANNNNIQFQQQHFESNILPLNTIMANINDKQLQLQQQQLQQNLQSTYYARQQTVYPLSTSSKQRQQQQQQSILPTSATMTTSTAYDANQMSDQSSFNRQQHEQDQTFINQQHQQQVLHNSNEQQFTTRRQQQQHQEQIQRDSNNDNGICFMDFSNAAAVAANSSDFNEPDPNQLVSLHDASMTQPQQQQQQKQIKSTSMNLNLATSTTQSGHQQQQAIPAAPNNPNCCPSTRIPSLVGMNPMNNPYLYNQHARQSSPHFQELQYQHSAANSHQQHQQQHLHHQQHHLQQHPLNQAHRFHHDHQSQQVVLQQTLNQQVAQQLQSHNQQTAAFGSIPIHPIQHHHQFSSTNNNNNSSRLQCDLNLMGGQQQQQLQQAAVVAAASMRQHPIRQNLKSANSAGGRGSHGGGIHDAIQQASAPSYRSDSFSSSTTSPIYPNNNNYNSSKQQQPAFGSGKSTPCEMIKNEVYDQVNSLLNIVYTSEDLVLRSNHKQEEVACSMTTGGALQKTLRQNQERYKAGDITLADLEHSRREYEQENASMCAAVAEVNELRKELMRNHLQIFRELCEIKIKVFANLNQWVLEQQLGSTNAVYHSSASLALYSSMGVGGGFAAGSSSTPTTGIGAQPTNSDHQTYALDMIESQIHMIVDVVNDSKGQIGRGAQKWCEEKWARFDENIREVSANLLQKYDRFLEDVIVKSFIVEKQPPQVMKTNTRFSSTCRFLCGNRMNILSLNPPQVKVTIISENTAKALMQHRYELLKRSWSLTAQQDIDDNEMMRLFYGSSRGSPGPVYSPASVPQNLSSPRSNASSTQTTIAADQQRQSSSCNQQDFPIPPSVGVYPNHLNDISSNRNLKVIDISRYENCGEIINNTNLMEFNESTRHVTCNFRNMQLKKIKRTEKKGTESVMDEKSILLFSAEFRTPMSANMDVYYQILAFSLPVVVIVHGNQESHAWATVTWHNAFARPTDYLYQVPDKVKWQELGQVLSEKFNSCTGRGLNAKNLDFLATKICRSSQINSARNMEVNWAQFAKEPLPDRSFTFWEWFYSMFKLTREHLRELWADDRIFGFIGKSGCIKLLGDQSINMGTFLLRFSEHELGGVTIAYVSSGDSQPSTFEQQQQQLAMDNQTSQSPTYGVTPEGNHICFVHPFVHKDLNTRSLADRIRDLRELVYLYPDFPKGEAFKKYYTPIYVVNETSDGYIKPMLVQVLEKDYLKNVDSDHYNDPAHLRRRGGPGSGESGENLVGPATPSSSSISSPGKVYNSNSNNNMNTVNNNTNNNNNNDNFPTDINMSNHDDIETSGDL